MKQTIKILLTSLLIFVALTAIVIFYYKNYSKSIIWLPNNKIFKYDKKLHRPEEAFDNYCFSLMGDELKSLEDKNYKYVAENINNQRPELKKCLVILNNKNYRFTNMTLISFAGYHWDKADILLNSYINYVEDNFKSDKKFISVFKNKIAELDKKTKKIIEIEVPYPNEGRQTHIFLYDRQAELTYIRLNILQGFVLDYCINNIENNSCQNFTFNREGKLQQSE